MRGTPLLIAFIAAAHAAATPSPNNATKITVYGLRPYNLSSDLAEKDTAGIRKRETRLGEATREKRDESTPAEYCLRSSD